MTKKIQGCFLAIALIVLSSCNSTIFEAYYNSEVIPPECFEPISNDAHPQILEASDFDSAIKRYLSSDYIVLGSMNFVGEKVSQGEIADFAKLKESSLVILESHHKGTKTYSYLVPHRRTSTSRTYGDTPYYDCSSSLNYLNYEEKTKTTTTEWEEREYTVNMYEITCIFLAKKR